MDGHSWVTAAQVTAAWARTQGECCQGPEGPASSGPRPLLFLPLPPFEGERGSGKIKTSGDVHMEMTTLLCPFRSSGPEGIYKATRWRGAGGPPSYLMAASPSPPSTGTAPGRLPPIL